MSDHLIPEEISPDGAGFLPGLAIDFVIFGFHQNQLKILLLSYRNTDLLALPAGFIQETENLNDAARRVLAERTGLHNIFLEQFYVFGDRSRHDPAPMRAIMEAKGIVPNESHWLLRRFISVGYYALIDFTKAVPIPDPLSDSCDWYDLSSLPSLMLDHQTIVQKALETLRTDLDRKLIGFNLLSDTFTMADLQCLYETILDQPLHRSGFQRKMLSLGILERLDKKFSGGAHKAPYLYRFVAEKQPHYVLNNNKPINCLPDPLIFHACKRIAPLRTSLADCPANWDIAALSTSTPVYARQSISRFSSSCP